MIESIVTGDKMTESEVLERLQNIEQQKEALILYVLSELKSEYEDLKQPRTIPVNINITCDSFLPTMLDHGSCVFSYEERDELKKQLTNHIDKSLSNLYHNIEMKKYTKQIEQFKKKVDYYRELFKDNRFLLQSL